MQNELQLFSVNGSEIGLQNLLEMMLLAEIKCKVFVAMA